MIDKRRISMNIVILSLIETLGICMVGLIFFILFLFIPAEGIKIDTAGLRRKSRVDEKIEKRIDKK